MQFQIFERPSGIRPIKGVTSRKWDVQTVVVEASVVLVVGAAAAVLSVYMYL